MEAQRVIPPPISQSWWQRNWVGVIGGLAALACFVGLVFLIVFGIFKGSDAYADAIAHARSSPAVLHELGEPVEPGWWVSGSINITGATGSADFATTLRGPIGRGTLYVTAEKEAGRWKYRVLEVAVEGKSERIDLLGDRNGV
jgi:hypothetical protein